MEIENLEILKKEVYNNTKSLVESLCIGCKYNRSSLKDHDCILTDYEELYIQTIESMNLTKNTKEKLKEYFMQNY